MIGFRLHARFFVLIALFFGTLVLPSNLFGKHDNDISTWQTLGFNFYENDNWRLKGFGQTRFYDDSSFLATWLVAPVVEYKAHANFDIGAAYLLEDVRAECGDDYTRLHIFWLYIAPHWKLTDEIGFSMRHIAAFRAIESFDDQWVSRHQFSLNHKVTDFGPLTSLGIDTEAFYNYETNRLFENRFKPVKATFTISEQCKFQLYFMLQSKRFGYDSHWQNAYVFGQALSYKF